MLSRKFLRIMGISFSTAFLLFGFVSSGKSDEPLVSFKVMAPEIALKAALAAQSFCRDNGYQTTVAVVDRFGVTQVILRDRFAGAHTPSTAFRKAWTAVSFRTGTTELSELVGDGELPVGITHIDQALMVGGGLLIEAAGSIVGGIGVSGAPGGDRDDECGLAGIEAIEEDIGF